MTGPNNTFIKTIVLQSMKLMKNRICKKLSDIAHFQTLTFQESCAFGQLVSLHTISSEKTTTFYFNGEITEEVIEIDWASDQFYTLIQSQK